VIVIYLQYLLIFVECYSIYLSSVFTRLWFVECYFKRLQKPKFLPLQIIHLFILQYDFATKH